MKRNLSGELRKFNYLMGEINAWYHEAAFRLGLSDSALGILYAIYNEGNCCLLKDICKLSGLSKQTVNSTIRKLESQEILYLRPLGGKQKQVYFTDKGKEFARATVGRIVAMENRIYDRWTQETKEEYLRLTQEYLSALQKEMEAL